MIRKKIYFLTAKYFQFWAKIVLKKWQPFIIAVVGSAGKTSTLYLIEHILKPENKVKVSYKTNAVTSIPLNILSLEQKIFSIWEWLKIIILAPFSIFKNYEENIYLCEMDSDRTDEMKTHTDLIKPDIVCIPSLYATHTQNFKGKTEDEILKNLAYDFGFAIERTKKIVIANAESKLLENQLERTQAHILKIGNEESKNVDLKLTKHKMSLSGTKMEFSINIQTIKKLSSQANKNINLNFPYALVSEINSYSIGMGILVGLNCGIDIKNIIEKLKTWRLPSGRMNLFAGKKATTIIDSTYNSSFLALKDALKVLKIIGNNKTIAVLGDMRELGKLEKIEHKKAAQEIINQKIRRIILIGPAMGKYVFNTLLKAGYLKNRTVFKTNDPNWATKLLLSPDFLRQGETILVKGSQNTLFLEGIVEKLLASNKDKKFLCRREKIWEKKRKEIYYE